MTALFPGDRLADRYVVEKRLGEGGMGVVVEGFDERLGRAVAIKVLPVDRVGDSEARARLLREARAVAQVEHPSIVRVYDVGETAEGAVFVVMEIVRGRALRTRLEEGLPPRAVGLGWIRAVGEALSAAHKAGFVHRDIKPENVMIRDDGRAVLLDFGLARRIEGALAATMQANEQVTSAGTIVGTPAYLAPEQARGEELGPACDQFALAIVAYEVLVGGHPWRSDTGLVLAQMLSSSPRAPSLVQPELPPSLDAVFARALAKEPGQRYRDVGAFVTALEAVFAGDRDSLLAPTQRVESTPPPRASGDTTGRGQALTPRVTTKRPRMTTGRFVALGLAMVTIVFAMAVVIKKLRPRPPAVVARPALLSDDAVIGCAALAVEGDLPMPKGWLGAAAGTALCRQLRAALGGRADSVRFPAELLGVPRRPADDFPKAPWDGADARDRTLAAARALTAHVDGSIEARLDVFVLKVSLRDGSGRVLGEARVEAATVPLSALAAVQALRASGAIPPRVVFTADGAPYSGVTSVEGLMAIERFSSAVGTGDEVAACEAAVAQKASLGAAAAAFPGGCDKLESAIKLAPKPDLTLADPAFFWTNGAALWNASPEDAARIANEAAKRAATRPASAARYLRLLEAQAKQRAGDLSGALGTALSVQEQLAVEPDYWMLLSMLTFGQKSFGPTLRAAAAWQPDFPGHWGNATREIETIDERLPLLRRALLLGRRHPLTAINMATGLLRAGKVHEARAVAAQLTASDDASSKIYGELLLAEVEAAEGKLEAGLARLRAVLGKLRLGDTFEQNWVAVTALGLAQVVGRSAEVGKEIVDGMILSVPPRLELSSGWSERAVACTCLSVEGDLRKRCGAGLEKLRASHAFSESIPGTETLSLAAIKLGAGDQAGAIATLRPMLTGSSFPCREAIPTLLELAHIDDLVERVDAETLRAPGPFNGVGMAWVRAARRLSRAGEKAKAAALAKQVLAAWATTDAPSIPFLAELRAIAAAGPAVAHP